MMTSNRTRFWWVNHSRSARHELAGGYLWSPEKERNGARSEAYDNMTRVRPGDVVLSFAGGVVSHAGVFTASVRSEHRPESHGDVGPYWGDAGWFVPVRWTELLEPFIPRANIASIRRLLPERYSPLRQDGKGNQKLYLTEVSPTVFSIVVGGSFSADTSEELGRSMAERLADEIALHMMASSTPIETTVREQLVRARQGQGRFRDDVLRRYGQCVVTGVSDPRLLIASHIKPWRVCDSAEERLSSANGLALAPHIDRLFDQGLATFDEDGLFVCSSTIGRDDLPRLGLGPDTSVLRLRIEPDQVAFFDYHRDHIFGGGSAGTDVGEP